MHSLSISLLASNYIDRFAFPTSRAHEAYWAHTSALASDSAHPIERPAYIIVNFLVTTVV